MTELTVVASTSAIAGLCGAMASAEDSKLSQRVPTTTVLGSLMLQAVRLACSSAMPSYDAGYTAWTVIAALLGTATAVSLGQERAFETMPDGKPAKISTRVLEARAQEDGLCQDGRLCWVWMLVGPLVGGTTTLSLAYFTHKPPLRTCCLSPCSCLPFSHHQATSEAKSTVGW